MHASLLSFCPESLIIDDDMIGACLRCVRGIEVSDETLAFETVKDVCMGGPGHYLGHGQTLSMMETEYIYPRLGDRSSPKEWVEKGRPDLVESAIAAKKEILATRFPTHVPDAVDAAIRERFNIVLPRAEMKPS